MNKQYYYLISSLPELRLDDYKWPYRVNEFAAELDEHLYWEHRSYVRDILYMNDNIHIVDLALGYEKPSFPNRGNWSFEEIKRFFDLEHAEENDYITSFIKQYNERKKEKDKFIRAEIETLLWGMYYKKMIEHENSFIRKYFKFDFHLRNILNALNKRKFSIGTDVFLKIEEDEVVNKLDSSTLGDFGLSRYVDYMPALVEVFEKSDLLHTEKFIDQLRWSMIDEINKFMYFDIDQLLGYLVKLMLVERWISLDVKKGRQIFSQRTQVDENIVYQ